MVMETKVAKLTVSVPKGLITVADEVAREKKISRSKVVSMCLQELAEKRLRDSLIEGYKAMAAENLRLAEMAFEAQSEVVPEWK
jgi:metal-responsive CopG/Arc/MetJ family transcriptional regulator